MSAALRPYIGITGIATADEAAEVRRLFFDVRREVAPANDRDLMLGVLLKDSFEGHTGRHPKRYPDPSVIPDIFAENVPGVKNVIHFCCKVPPSLDTVERLLRHSGSYLHGIQFNGPWPSHTVLQWVGTRTMVDDLLHLDPFRVILQKRPDSPGVPAFAYVTDVLIDASMGEGVTMPASVAGEAHRLMAHLCVRSMAADIDISYLCYSPIVGVAGGLCAETVLAMPHVWRSEGIVMPISMDAEGRLRDAEDNLDMKKVKAYLLAALKVTSP